jgi:hypothetical protein
MKYVLFVLSTVLMALASGCVRYVDDPMGFGAILGMIT